MHVLIIAINHQIQSAMIGSMSTNGNLEAFERGQKEAFGEMIRVQIRQRGVQFVGEEARHGQETVAQRVCGMEQCRHANIEKEPEERQRRQIPLNYWEDPNVSEADKARFNCEREAYMINRTITGAGQAENVILICGRLHRDAIAEDLRRREHIVDEIDLQDQSWYIENWMEHMLDL